MKIDMPEESLRILRVTIIIQALVATWFVFSPDFVADVIRDAEMANDRPLYVILDSIIVPMTYFQSILCITLWWPSKIRSWTYLLTGMLLMALNLFAGPLILSSVDGFFSSLQELAAGVMIAILYFSNFFKCKRE